MKWTASYEVTREPVVFVQAWQVLAKFLVWISTFILCRLYLNISSLANQRTSVKENERVNMNWQIVWMWCLRVDLCILQRCTWKRNAQQDLRPFTSSYNLEKLSLENVPICSQRIGTNIEQRRSWSKGIVAKISLSLHLAGRNMHTSCTLHQFCKSSKPLEPCL